MLRDPDDRTCARVVYANSTEGDVLLRAELDELAAQHAQRLQVRLGLSARFVVRRGGCACHASA